MTTQLTAFPPTVPELLAAYRRRLEADLEKAVDRWVKADEARDEAQAALMAFDAAMVAQETVPPITVVETVTPPDSPTVLVSGPAVEPFPLKVGERTRFMAVVYAWAEQSGVKEVVESDYVIVDEAGSAVDGRSLVDAASYGRTFTVVRAS